MSNMPTNIWYIHFVIFTEFEIYLLLIAEKKLLALRYISINFITWVCTFIFRMKHCFMVCQTPF